MNNCFDSSKSYNKYEKHPWLLESNNEGFDEEVDVTTFNKNEAYTLHKCINRIILFNEDVTCGGIILFLEFLGTP